MIESMYVSQILNNIQHKLDDDDDFLVKIQVKISKMTNFQSTEFLNQFDKWCATRASKDGMGGEGGVPV